MTQHFHPQVSAQEETSVRLEIRSRLSRRETPLVILPTMALDKGSELLRIREPNPGPGPQISAN